MTINSIVRSIGLLAITGWGWSCKQQSDTPAPASSVVVTATTNTTLSPTIVPLTYAPAPPTRNQPEYVFDWENAPFVPNPSTVAPIPTPWNDQAKRAFSDDIRYDYKRADGWVMVYSPFTNQQTATNPLLVLYNKYRGLLRYYVYVSGGTQNVQGDNVIIQKVTTVGNAASSSPLLNFAEQSVVDIAKNAQLYSTIEPQAISDKTWYAVQIELAYDPKLAAQTVELLGLGWSVNADLVSSIRLNGGKTLSTVPVGLHVEGGNFYNSSQPSFTGTGQLLINGSLGLTNLQTAGQDVSGLTASLGTPSTSTLLDGILPTPSTTTSSLIPLSATVQLVKPIGNSALIMSPFLALPGYDNSKTVGVGPQYNEAPGLFYLDSKPVITTQTSASAGSYTYSLDVASVRYLFNPAVTNSADIRNIRQEIVATAVAAPEATPSVNSTLYTGTSLMANQALNVVGVRVSFDVVPKSGSAPVHIIKTFKADIKPQ